MLFKLLKETILLAMRGQCLPASKACIAHTPRFLILSITARIAVAVAVD